MVFMVIMVVPMVAMVVMVIGDGNVRIIIHHLSSYMQIALTKWPDVYVRMSVAILAQELFAGVSAPSFTHPPYPTMGRDRATGVAAGVSRGSGRGLDQHADNRAGLNRCETCQNLSHTTQDESTLKYK